MKNKLIGFLLVLGILGFVYLPSQVKAADTHSGSEITSSKIAVAKDVRYVRVRGKRYKVWYKTYYRKGKRYVKITKMRRA